MNDKIRCYCKGKIAKNELKNDDSDFPWALQAYL